MNKYIILMKSGHELEINYKEEGNKNLIGLWVWASRQREPQILSLVDEVSAKQHAVNSDEVATITQVDYYPQTDPGAYLKTSARSGKGRSLIAEKEQEQDFEKEVEEAYSRKIDEGFYNLVQSSISEQESEEFNDIKAEHVKRVSTPRNWRTLHKEERE